MVESRQEALESMGPPGTMVLISGVITASLAVMLGVMALTHLTGHVSTLLSSWQGGLSSAGWAMALAGWLIFVRLVQLAGYFLGGVVGALAAAGGHRMRSLWSLSGARRACVGAGLAPLLLLGSLLLGLLGLQVIGIACLAWPLVTFTVLGIVAGTWGWVATSRAAGDFEDAHWVESDTASRGVYNDSAASVVQEGWKSGGTRDSQDARPRPAGAGRVQGQR